MKTHKMSKKKASLRPTSGKVKESLFNILQDKVRNSRLLDLYAGTGAVGMEAIRRGADEVVFVEAAKGNAQKIAGQLEACNYTERGRALNRKALPFIQWAESNNLAFDIIFLDPPYHAEEIMQVLKAIDKSAILSQNGIVIAEHSAKKHLPERLEFLYRKKEYRYGDTMLTLFVRHITEEAAGG